MKAAILIALRFLAVAVVHFAAFVAVSGALLSTTAEQPAPADAAATLLALFIVSLISAAVWTYIILRSQWTGWKLILSVFLIFFGVSTVMSQIETAYFVTGLPPGMLPRLFLAGLIIAAVFAPLAVLILGKVKAHSGQTAGDTQLNMPVSKWIVKLSIIVIVYVVIYFTFGYFIAWRNPAVRAYYGGSDPAGFISHVASVLRNEPMLFLLQALRALLWAAMAVPVIKMLKGRRWESELAVALLFGVFMTAPLLLPNTLMPAEVRMAHLLETASSNFLFGWLLVLILRPERH